MIVRINQKFIGALIGINAGLVFVASANACDLDSAKSPKLSGIISEKNQEKQRLFKKEGSGKVQENLSTSKNLDNISDRKKMQMSRDYILGVKKIGATQLHTKSNLILKGGIPGI